MEVILFTILNKKRILALITIIYTSIIKQLLGSENKNELKDNIGNCSKCR